MRPLRFSSACLAPLTLTAFACSGSGPDIDPPPRDGGSTEVRDAGVAPGRDGGEIPGRDAGQIPGRDAGFRDAGQTPRDAGQQNCTYPVGAVEPMALGEVMTPYRWQTAIALEGGTFTLDLEDVFCNTTPGFDWSVYDALLFVTLPEW